MFPFFKEDMKNIKSFISIKLRIAIYNHCLIHEVLPVFTIRPYPYNSSIFLDHYSKPNILDRKPIFTIRQSNQDNKI